MTPHKAKGGRTLMIDRRFQGVGRISRASGTTHKPTFRGINDMLTDLFARGELAVLRQLRDGTLAFIPTWERWKAGTLSGDATMRPLAAAWTAWADAAQVTPESRRSYGIALQRLLAETTGEPVIADLPDLLEALRVRLQAAKTARAFNLTRTHALTFLRATLKRSHRLYAAVSDVLTLKRMVPKRDGWALTVAEVDTVCRWIRAHEDTGGGRFSPEVLHARAEEAARLVWTMAVTGMHWKEVAGDWSVGTDRVVIHGTKREARERAVPRVFDPRTYQRPVLHTERSFYGRFTRATKATIGRRTPYDLRRTFAALIEHIPRLLRSRDDFYQGHGPKTMSELYRKKLAKEVEPFLVADAEALKAFIAAERAAAKGGLTLEEGDA